MTIYAVYAAENGQLWSVAQSADKVASADILQARGFAVKEFPDGSDAGPWNASTLSFDPPQPVPALIAAADFILLFTPTEAERIYSSSNLQLKQILRALAIKIDPIDLHGPIVMGGLALITALGLFDDQNGVPGAPSTRPAAIQTATPPA